MASAGPNSGSAVSTSSDTTYGTGVEKPWSDTGNVFADDGAYAQGELGSGAVAYTERLDITGFGFAIPAGATIDGIVASINAWSNNSARAVRDVQVRLLIGGTPSGTNLADGRTWTAEATENYGGISNTWGLTPSVAQINASNFGIGLQFDNNGATTLRVPRLDHVTLTVYYTAGGGGGTTYTQSASGSLTAAGALSRKTKRTLAGSSTPAGAVRKKTNRLLAGSLTATGAVRKLTQRALAGGITATGAVTSRSVFRAAVAGSVTATGALRRLTRKGLAGSITAAGALRRKTSRTLAGTITAAGDVMVRFFQAVAGTITPTGALATEYQSGGGTPILERLRRLLRLRRTRSRR